MMTCWVRSAVSAATEAGQGEDLVPGRWCAASWFRPGRRPGLRPRCGRCCCPAAARSASARRLGVEAQRTGPGPSWPRRHRAATGPRSGGPHGTWRSPRRSRCARRRRTTGRVRTRLHPDPPRTSQFDVAEPVGQGEGELLDGGRPCLPDVVPGDRQRLVAGVFCPAVSIRVADEAQCGLRLEQPLLLRDVFLEDVGLQGAVQAWTSAPCRSAATRYMQKTARPGR